MIEQPNNSLEREQRDPVSLLYLETEHPTERARAVANLPEFRESIENRVNEALYNNRALPSILFPKIPGRMGSAVFSSIKQRLPEKVSSKLPDLAPTFDKYINAQVFAHEEAVGLDRLARTELADRGTIHPSDRQLEEEIDRMLKVGMLRPADLKQIEREEKWRRHLIAFAESFRRGSFTEAEALAGILSKAAREADSEMVADYFHNIIAPLLDDAYDQWSVEKKYPEILELLYLASLCTFLPQDQYAPKAQLVMGYPEAREALATGFLRIIEGPRYESLVEMWKAYGIPEWTIIQSIRARADQFIGSRLTKNNRVDVDGAEKALDTLQERRILSEKEARALHLDVFRALAKREIEKVIEYQKMLDKEIHSGYDTKAYNEARKKREAFGANDFKKEYVKHQNAAVKKGLCSARDFSKHPDIKKAAEQYLVERFGNNHFIEGLLIAASQISSLGIMGYDDALNAKPILDSVTKEIEMFFVLDDERAEELYHDAIRGYLNAKIGTRAFFDAIKKSAIERRKETDT